MNKVTEIKPRSKIWDKFQEYKVHHFLYWLVIFILLNIGSNSTSAAFFLLFSLIVAVYLNLGYLIPKYLPSEFVKYTVMLALLCALIAPITQTIHSLVMPGRANLGTTIIFFLMIFFFTGTSTVMKITKKWFQQQQDSLALEKSSMQSELKFLKSQINPHFLFNTLNNLYALTLKKSDKAPDIVIKLSEMMRYMLYECNEKRVPLRKEINYIKNYLDLEKLRQGDRSNITFECTGDIQDQRIAPLMFIPFLENSFKHGVNSRIQDGFVHISIKVNKNELICDISNSKPPPIPNPGVRKVGGIGLMNVKRRLNLIYPNGYNLEIKNLPTEYNVHLELELDK